MLQGQLNLSPACSISPKKGCCGSFYLLNHLKFDLTDIKIIYKGCMHKQKTPIYTLSLLQKHNWGHFKKTFQVQLSFSDSKFIFNTLTQGCL